MMFIDFYGERVKVPKPKCFKDLKGLIEKEYGIEKDELEGLALVFENQNMAKELVTESTYSMLMRKSEPVLFVSVSENSKLFQFAQNEPKQEVKNPAPSQEPQQPKPQPQPQQLPQVKSSDSDRSELQKKMASLQQVFNKEHDKHEELALKKKEAESQPDKQQDALEKVIEKIVDNKFNEAKKGIIEGALMETNKLSSLMMNSNHPHPTASFLSITDRSICNSEHQGIQCRGCNAFPIKGLRFKCAACPSYDLCEKCEENLGQQHQHPFLKVRFPLA